LEVVEEEGVEEEVKEGRKDRVSSEDVVNRESVGWLFDSADEDDGG